MGKQVDIFGNEWKPPTKPVDKDKRNWENGFQRWSDKESQDETTPCGKCGYGSMCDFCKNNTYGRPCVRALNDMRKKHNLTIDYKNKTDEYYLKVWEGDF